MMKKTQRAYRLFLLLARQEVLCFFVFLIPFSGFAVVGSIAPDNDTVRYRSSDILHISEGVIVFNENNIHISKSPDNKTVTVKNNNKKQSTSQSIVKKEIPKTRYPERKEAKIYLLPLSSSSDIFFSSLLNKDTTILPVQNYCKNLAITTEYEKAALLFYTSADFPENIKYFKRRTLYPISHIRPPPSNI